MAAYDDIYEVAADNHGLFTSSDARGLGISDKEMSRLAHDGRLIRLGYGVYQIRHHVPEPADPYAVSVALVGDGAYLYGESVLAMHGLCPTDPRRIYDAMPVTRRSTMPFHPRRSPQRSRAAWARSLRSGSSRPYPRRGPRGS